MKKKPLIYIRKKRGKTAIMLDSELFYERANYTKLFCKKADIGKILPQHRKFSTGVRKARLSALKI